MAEGTKVLMVSSDRNILAQGSAVSERMKGYGGLVKELHIILLSDRAHGLKPAKISENVWVYPTNSLHKFLRPFRAVKIGKKIMCDLITTQDPFECGWVGLKLKNRLSVPLEVQLHTDPFSPYFSGIINLVRKFIAKKVLEKADGIRVVSESLASKIKSPRTSVLPIYVDRKRIESKPTFDLHEKYHFKFVVLTVSRLSLEKDVAQAIKIISSIKEAGLVIVGSGPEEKRLKTLAERLDILGRIIFVGWQEDLASYYKTADVFIQTSKFEGYGLSLVEAGLSGLPVVSTAVGIANDLGNVKIAEDRKSFVSVIEGLMKDESGRKILGDNLKKELESEICTKEEYLIKLKENWTKLSQK